MGETKAMKQAITAREIIARGDASYNTIWKRWRKEFPGVAFDQDRALTGEDLELLGLLDGEAWATRPFFISAPQATAGNGRAKEPADYSNLAIRFGLWAITLTTVAMLFVGGFLLWRWVGLLTAATVSVFLICAQVLATDRRKSDASEHALAVCFLIELCAAWLHNATFRNWLETDKEMAGSAWAVCWVLALMFSAISFSAVWISRRMTVDDDLYNAFNLK